ncbi:telomere length regulation protein TEL2 homolog isoform X2 [Cydia pomonella]|uniref:telomere length regulation protein TEL2 homolog isoform X2 n=1 Tax=Cydia pomonella TaxID=82600 RepID=UPI002ADD612F|nr:telomere length regulation protein TEL2 homolog isoform X2 [Cydia pomonella]
MLWRRMLYDNRSHFRRTYKCLLLLSYLVRNGSERVVTSAREHIYDLRSLENYTYVDDVGKDQGINVRHKVRELIDFIQDDDKLREERKKAKKNKDKYIGMSSEAGAMGMRGSGGWGEYSDRGGGGSNWDEPKERNDEDDYDRADDSDGDYSHGPGHASARKPNKENIYRDDGAGSPPPRSLSSRSGERERDRDTDGYVSAAGLTSPTGLSSSANTLNISLKSPAKTKSSTPTKKIDLGAAASYGKSAATPAPTPAASAGDQSHDLLDDLFKTCPGPVAAQGGLLEDDFDPRAEEPKPAPTSSTEFGDFTNAFGAPEPVSNDGFADFTSAFTGAPTNFGAPAAFGAPASNNFIAPASNNFVAPASNNFVAPASNNFVAPASNNFVTLASNNFGASAMSNSFVANVTTPVNNNAAPAPASNVDLLGELAPPAPAAAPAPAPLADVTLQPTHAENEKTKTDLRRELKTLVDALHGVERVSSASQSKKLASHLEEVLKILPGPITVQKLSRIDEKSLNSEVLEVFVQCLSSVVRVLIASWPLFKNEISTMFTVEESFEVSQETLAVLCGFLKNESNEVILNALVSILTDYVKSDAILIAIIDCSSVKFDNVSERYKQQNEWESYIQLLVTLPERIANKLEKHTPKNFSHENYSYNLIFHIIRSMDFMTESSYAQNIQYDISYLSFLVSKVIIDYNMSGNSDAIFKFIDTLIAWSTNETDTMFIRRKLIHKMFFHLNRQAIDFISLTLLYRSPIDYKNSEQTILHVLGDNFDQNKDWKEILTYRIPLYIQPKDYKDTTIPENLIYYLSTTKDSKVLTELVLKLCRVWSDVKHSNVRDITHHMYTSQLLILAIKYCVMIHTENKENWSLNEIKTVLYKGMSKHLDVMSQAFRCIGMATIEIILKLLAELDDTDKAAENLSFDYKEMGPSCVEIHNQLKELTHKCIIDAKRKIPKDFKPKSIDLKGILDLIAMKVIDEHHRPVHNNTIMTCAVKSPEQTKEIVKTIISVKLDALDKSKTLSEDLDSDDDLQPYDMSNDIAIADKNKPAYVRDLIELITEAKDAEIFETAVESAEELITKQLKNEDPKLATELLDLFIHLDAKFHVDDFDNIKFNTAVAILCSHPKVCAEHICKEIHTDVGRYSIATKIFMLDVFSEAANRIADVRPQSEPKLVKPDVLNQEEENASAEEIIRRRLIQKTRYFHSKRPHPFAKAKKNQFAAVADSFFYPLVGGFGIRQLSLSHQNQKQDIDNILLFKYLSVIGNIILASKNCPKCPSYCWDVVQMILYLRYTPDPKIQSCVIAMLASVIIALPKFILLSEFVKPMAELRAWLEDMIKVDITTRLNGPASETAIFAAQVISLLEKNLCCRLRNVGQFED